MAVYQLNKHGSNSSSLDFALRKFTKFSVFLALEYTPITGLTEIANKKEEEDKGVVLKFCSCMHFPSFLSHPLRFWLGLLFTALKLQKLAIFMRRKTYSKF